MRKNKLENNIVLGAVITCFGLGIVFATASMLVMFNAGNVIVENEVIKAVEVRMRDWRPMPLAASGNTSCFVYFVHWAHSGDPGTDYANVIDYNTSDGYEYTTSLDSEMTGETPYDTTFDTVMLLVVNRTVGYNETGATWEITWVRANLTCSELSLTDQEMVIVEVSTGTDYAWYHAYLQDSDGGAGSGFTISHGESVNHTSVTADGYW